MTDGRNLDRDACRPSQPSAHLDEDIGSSSAATLVDLVRVQAMIEFSSLLGSKRKRRAVRGDAVPQVLYELDALFNGEVSQFDIHDGVSRRSMRGSLPRSSAGTNRYFWSVHAEMRMQSSTRQHTPAVDGVGQEAQRIKKSSNSIQRRF